MGVDEKYQIWLKRGKRSPLFVAILTLFIALLGFYFIGRTWYIVIIGGALGVFDTLVFELPWGMVLGIQIALVVYSYNITKKYSVWYLEGISNHEAAKYV